MELKDTIEMMCCDDYEERFKAEYYQTKIRCKKLHDVISGSKRKQLDFEPRCTLKTLRKQESIMNQYIKCLEERANVEGISL